MDVLSPTWRFYSQSQQQGTEHGDGVQIQRMTTYAERNRKAEKSIRSMDNRLSLGLGDRNRSRTRSCPPLKGGRNTTPLIGNKKAVISIWIWMTHMLSPLKAFQTMDRTALNPSSMLAAGPTGRENYLLPRTRPRRSKTSGQSPCCDLRPSFGPDRGS